VIARLRGGDIGVKAGRKGNVKNPWSGFSVTSLEADLAYFQARLELLGQPSTINQKAQAETFSFLIESMTRLLSKLKRRQPMIR